MCDTPIILAEWEAARVRSEPERPKPRIVAITGLRSSCKVRLLGALSKTDGAVRRIERANEARIRLLAADEGETKRRKAVRLPQGAMQTTILDVLQAAGEVLAIGEVHARVSEVLGQRVSRDTVTSFLSVACRDDQSRVVRVGRGVYGVR